MGGEHLQEKSLCDLGLGVKFMQNVANTLYIMLPMQLQCLKLLRQTVYEELHLKENTLLDLGVKVTGNVVQYPLHHVTYSAAKFEVATSNILEDAFTRKYIMVTRNVAQYPLHHVTYAAIKEEIHLQETWRTHRQPDRLWYEIKYPFSIGKPG